MSHLQHPNLVVHLITAGRDSLSRAHAAAGESEGDRSDLTGQVRDLLFGVNTTLDALVQMIEEGRFSEEQS